MRHPLKTVVLFFGAGSAVAILVIGAAMGFVKQSVDVPLGDGAVAHIKPASTWGSLRTRATASITCESKETRGGTVLLWQDFFHWPITVIPSSSSNVVLCLYEFDVDLRLLRIDTARKFKPFPSGSVLTQIVCSSTWSVEAGTTNDWQEALAYLRKLPSGAFKRQSVPALSFGIVRLHSRRDLILDRIETSTSIVSDR